MRVLIFGCGPAGLFAAHAAAGAGHSLAIVSKNRKSEMFGAQYLHQAVPCLAEGVSPRMVSYRLQGTEEGYRRKVYAGSRYDGTVSPGELAANHVAYDIRAAYDEAWGLYGGLVQDYLVDNGASMQEVIVSLDPDVVFSTFPAARMCVDPEHQFRRETIWAIGDAPERGQYCPVSVPDETIVCNGEDAPAWYRASRVFGYSTAEWPGRKKPPLEGIAAVDKPLSTDCDCHENVVRLGRYGQWAKGVLSHEAYYYAKTLLKERS